MEQGYIQSIIQNYEEDLQKVKQNGYALAFVEEQTPELCFEAVKQDAHALYFVKDPVLQEQIKLHLNL